MQDTASIEEFDNNNSVTRGNHDKSVLQLQYQDMNELGYGSTSNAKGEGFD
jgi:hypothetical protein